MVFFAIATCAAKACFDAADPGFDRFLPAFPPLGLGFAAGCGWVTLILAAILAFLVTLGTTWVGLAVAFRVLGTFCTCLRSALVLRGVMVRGGLPFCAGAFTGGFFLL